METPTTTIEESQISSTPTNTRADEPTMVARVTELVATVAQAGKIDIASLSTAMGLTLGQTQTALARAVKEKRVRKAGRDSKRHNLFAVAKVEAAAPIVAPKAKAPKPAVAAPRVVSPANGTELFERFRLPDLTVVGLSVKDDGLRVTVRDNASGALAELVPA